MEHLPIRGHASRQKLNKGGTAGGDAEVQPAEAAKPIGRCWLEGIAEAGAVHVLC
jgi:hypothetical protein